MVAATARSSIARAIRDRKGRGVKTIGPAPGNLQENAHINGFHDKPRDECPHREPFGSLPEAPGIIEAWRVEYGGLPSGFALPAAQCRNKQHQTNGWTPVMRCPVHGAGSVRILERIDAWTC